MGIRALIFPTCKELAERLARGGYDGSPWPVRLAVRWHLLGCELCRVYARQVELLGAAYRLACAKDAAPTDLKARLAEKIRREGV